MRAYLYLYVIFATLFVLMLLTACGSPEHFQNNNNQTVAPVTTLPIEDEEPAQEETGYEYVDNYGQDCGQDSKSDDEGKDKKGKDEDNKGKDKQKGKQIDHDKTGGK